MEREVAINEIIEAYNEQFQGAAVKQVTNKDDFKVGFGVDEDYQAFRATVQLSGARGLRS